MTAPTTLKAKMHKKIQIPARSKAWRRWRAERVW
jgi:hypothetical protein